MENNKLREIDIRNRTCYFDDIIDINDLDNNLFYEKSYENTLIYDVA